MTNHTEQHFDHLVRASNFIPIPDEQMQLDTPSQTVRFGVITMNMVTCVAGTISNVLTLLIVIVR